MDGKAAARIHALTLSPGWDDLTQVLTELEEKFWKRHRADLTRGTEIEPLQLARSLGKFDGIRVILGAPDKAAAILLREQEKDDAA